MISMWGHGKYSFLFKCRRELPNSIVKENSIGSKIAVDRATHTSI